ncbi:hypothetical protein AVEN_165120-1, partial [Araneus ventricosus]
KYASNLRAEVNDNSLWGEIHGASLRLDKFSLVIFKSRFEAIRGLFWDGPRNFEPRSDDEGDT